MIKTADLLPRQFGEEILCCGCIVFIRMMDVHLRQADHFIALPFHPEAEIRIVESEKEILVPKTDSDLCASADHMASAYCVIYFEGLGLVHVVKRVLVIFTEQFHV